MVDSEFMSAKDKELVLKQWKNFLRKIKVCNFESLTGADYGYFPTELNKPFSNRLYLHLSNHFGFIAHYNRLGFLSERFGHFDKTVETLNQMRTHNLCLADYTDINDAIRKTIIPAGHPENVSLVLG